jgi:hypothetical protein
MKIELNPKIPQVGGLLSIIAESEEESSKLEQIHEYFRTLKDGQGKLILHLILAGRLENGNYLVQYAITPTQEKYKNS